MHILFNFSEFFYIVRYLLDLVLDDLEAIEYGLSLLPSALSYDICKLFRRIIEFFAEISSYFFVTYGKYADLYALRNAALKFFFPFLDLNYFLL